jgi:hypothetical protein
MKRSAHNRLSLRLLAAGNGWTLCLVQRIQAVLCEKAAERLPEESIAGSVKQLMRERDISTTFHKQNRFRKTLFIYFLIPV